MKVTMVGLAGPSGSGKSTLARRAQREWPDLEVIKLDKFFRDAVDFPMVGNWRNWELPENVCFDELYEVLRELKAGRAVEVPIYSKPEGRRTGSRLATPQPMVMVEGFLLFSDPRVRDLIDLKVYLDVPLELQLQRRQEREPGFDRDYFNEVMVPAFERYGADAKRRADVVIDGSGPQEQVWQAFRRALSSSGMA
jgi:uridine kinase